MQQYIPLATETEADLLRVTILGRWRRGAFHVVGRHDVVRVVVTRSASLCAPASLSGVGAGRTGEYRDTCTYHLS